MIGNYTFKFQGIIKGFDLDNITRATFPILIAANIFDVTNLLSHVNYCGIDSDADTWGISGTFFYNHKEYSLKNEIYEDMFDRCELRCESPEILNESICEVDFDLEMQVSAQSKIKYLKNKVAEISNEIAHIQKVYLLYCGKGNVDFYNSWFEFFRDEQVENEDFSFIFKYLLGDNDFVPTIIDKAWRDCFLVKNLTQHCKKRIIDIENVSGLKESEINIEPRLSSINRESKIDGGRNLPNFGSAIFCEDGEDIFKYIISRYPRAHNKAFFSYLYFYLRDNMKIVFLGNDSFEYRDYVIANYDITSFSKIQVTVTDNISAMKNKVYGWFNSYYSDFIQLKENGRKIE